MSGVKGAASAAPEFPRTLAAAQKAEADLWLVADAVLFEVGSPTDNGWQDGSEARFEQCAEYLAEHGLDYSPNRLRDLRNTAVAFTAAERSAAVTFTAHQRAGSPEVLAEAIRRNGGNPPSERFVRQVARELRDKQQREEMLRQEREHRRAAEKAERERQKAEAAENERARLRAEERARQAAAEADRIWCEQQAAIAAQVERERKEAERKAAQVAEALEDKRVAEALASSKSLGSRRISNAIREHEGERRRKVREENERIAAAGAMPLPAYVPEMIDKITEWSATLSALADHLGDLPQGEPLVATLQAAVTELRDQANRWVQALGDAPVVEISAADVIESGGVTELDDRSETSEPRQSETSCAVVKQGVTNCYPIYAKSFEDFSGLRGEVLNPGQSFVRLQLDSGRVLFLGSEEIEPPTWGRNET